ncbi:hypothetical protein EMIHUDRAFT_453347, partial [Emiliania huxleyi CCMP1516]|uniref:ubiquitinyl hydrolase 1 n=2 Tax=Emiliania huxleyi TaxID=2903 RepID=A0A0D3I8I8_EMIH1
MHGPTPPNRPRGTTDGGKTCAVCEKPSTTRCSKCKEVMYCSVECQRLDWKAGHKQVCCSGTSASALAAKSAAAAALPPPWEPFKPDPEVEALIDEGAAAPVTGMANVGNTCFLNVVVQCLFHGPLWHYMQRGLPRHKPPAEHEQGCGEPDCVICELNELVRMYANPGARKWIAPRSVVRKTLSACAGIGVDFGRMHDSHEFAIAGIINRLLNANLRGAPEASGSDEYDCLECQTLQHHLFGALYASVVTCESCGHQTGRMQRDANGFTLALTGRTPETPETGLRAWVRGAAQRVGERVGVVEGTSESVEELLKFDFEGESLEDYKCDGCGKKMDEMDGKRIVKR